MDSIQLLYIILLGFLLMCLASVLIVEIIDKNESYIRFKYFLISLIASYILSFAFGGTPLSAALLFSLQFIPVYLLTDFFMSGALEVKLKTLGLCHLGAILSCLILHQIGFSFTAFCLPLVITAYSPALYYMSRLLYKKKSASDILFFVVYFIGALNFLSFSFYRFVPGTEIWGWSAAILNYILIMFCFYVVILEKKVVLDSNLKQELQMTNTLYKTLIHDTSNDLNFLSLNLARAIKRDDISIVKKASDRLNELIRFKTEMRRQYQSSEAKSHKLEISSILSKIDKNYLPLFQSKKIRLIKNINNFSNDFVIGLSEEVLVKTVLGNILTNSQKFSQENSTVQIEINIGDKYFEFSVLDTGPGIPDNIIEQVRKYSKVTSSKGTSNELGSGLGLGIVCFIIDKVRGKIEFINNGSKGLGTLVNISLPLYTKVEEKTDLPRPSRFSDSSRQHEEFAFDSYDH